MTPQANERASLPDRRLKDGAAQQRRLRVCLILEPLHAGVGRHTVDLALALADRGHEIHVIYSPIRLERDFLHALAAHPGIRCQAVEMMPGLSLKDVRAFWLVQQYVRRHGPFDIVHGESSKGGGFARLLKLFGARRVLYSPHAFITLSSALSPAKHRFFAGLEILLSRLTDVIVCSSQSECDHAVGLGISPRKLAVIVNGRAASQGRDRAHLRSELGFSTEAVVIGFAGRLETQKAPHRIIEACTRLLAGQPHLHLLMIGDGPYRPQLETRVRKAGLAQRVTWLGAVNAVEYMPAMDLLVVPSLYEGFAYVLLEGLQAGLPLVATPVGGTHESITPGKNGIIVPHNPIEPLVAALRQIGLDAGLRQRMSEASRARAAYFTVPRMVDGMEALYRQVADGRARPVLSAKFSAVSPSPKAV
jgi:glycosyltransferase involved in cell wall biosynthesis